MYMWIYTHVINSGIFISDVVKCQRPYIDDLGLDLYAVYHPVVWFTAAE